MKRLIERLVVRKVMRILSKAGVLGSWETENAVEEWLNR